jgi:hypothetical protein
MTDIFARVVDRRSSAEQAAAKLIDASLIQETETEKVLTADEREAVAKASADSEAGLALIEQERDARSAVIKPGTISPFEFATSEGHVIAELEASGHWHWPLVRTQQVTVPGEDGDEDLIEIARTGISDAALVAGNLASEVGARAGLIAQGEASPFQFVLGNGAEVGELEPDGHWHWPWMRTKRIAVSGPDGDEDLVVLVRGAVTTATAAETLAGETAALVAPLAETVDAAAADVAQTAARVDAVLDTTSGDDIFSVRLTSGETTLAQRGDGVLEAGGFQASGPVSGDVVTAREALYLPTGAMVPDVMDGPFAHMIGRFATFWQDSDGLFNVPSLRTHGDASIDGDLYIGGRLFEFDAGTPGPVLGINPVPFVSQASIDLINAEPVTQGDGSALPEGTEGPPMLSVDVAAYGWRYAALAPSCLWVGDRFWVAAYGQNVEPDGPGEEDGAFAYLRYTDNFFDDEPVWHEVLFMVPRTTDGRAIDPMISLMPDGSLLWQTATTGLPLRQRACYAVRISNPQALNGIFDVGRIYWMGWGIPARPKQIGGRIFGPYDNWPQKMIVLRELALSGLDAVAATDFATLPAFSAPTLYQVPETALDAISGGRIRALFRTPDGIYQAVSSPGGVVWPDTPAKWEEYASGNTRATQERSPSGRLIRVWNRNAGARDNLSVALSEDDGATFPWWIEIDRSRPGKQPNYPSLHFKVIDGETWLFAAYDWGRKTSEDKETKFAAFREEQLRAGTLTLADITYRLYSS